jgi:hypothetical protein
MVSFNQEMGVDKVRAEHLDSHNMLHLLLLLSTYLEFHTEESCTCHFQFGNWYYSPRLYHIYFTILLSVGSKCKKHRPYWNKPAFIVRINCDKTHTTESYQVVCNTPNHPESVAHILNTENNTYEDLVYRRLVYDPVFDRIIVVESTDETERISLNEIEQAA